MLVFLSAASLRAQESPAVHGAVLCYGPRVSTRRALCNQHVSLGSTLCLNGGGNGACISERMSRRSTKKLHLDREGVPEEVEASHDFTFRHSTDNQDNSRFLTWTRLPAPWQPAIFFGPLYFNPGGSPLRGRVYNGQMDLMELAIKSKLSGKYAAYNRLVGVSGSIPRF